MTLDDFFTLTEMKDGLTSLGRIEELVCLMKKDNCSAVKNVAEAVRQWSTVASTLVATENQGSLDHFIHLDGLCFLDRWLQEAATCSNDVADCTVDESISVLLGALKKLPIDNEKSVSSGIAATVKILFGHKSVKIQEKARDLFDGWKQRWDDNPGNANNLENGECHDDGVEKADRTVNVNSGHQEHSSLDITPLKESATEDIPVVKPTETEFQPSRDQDGSITEIVKDVDAAVSNSKDNFHTAVSKVNKEGGFQDDAEGLCSKSNPLQESNSINDESPAHIAERMTSMGICSSSDPVKEKSLDVPVSKDLTNGVSELNSEKGIPGELGDVGPCSISTQSEPEPVSSTDPANIQQLVIEPPISSNADTKESDPACLDEGRATVATDQTEGEFGSGPEKHLRTGEDDGCYSENSSDGCLLRKPEHLKTSVSRKEGTEAVDNVNEHSDDSFLKVEGGKEYASTGRITIPVVDKLSDINKSSDLDLEYGVDDAVEVALQVAKEIAREVVDYREQFSSSSSEKNPVGGLDQPSPNSVNSEKDQSVVGPQNDMQPDQNLIDGSFFPKEDGHLMDSEHADKPEDCLHGTGSSQVTEAVQIPANTSKIGLCDFDLNEVCSEETDCPRMPRSVPITMVSARVAHQGLRRSPPRFEGGLGWKGSAATSAFRPATGFKASDAERTLSIEGSSQSLRERRNILGIDLNQNADEGYGEAVDGVANPTLGTQIPVSSGLPSGESSIEVSSRRAERLKIDLNRVFDSDDGGPSSDPRMEGPFTYHHQNSSPSPASSSSSRHPPSVKNFDLNGNPSSLDDYLGPSGSSSIDVNVSVGFKADERAISIFGSKLQLKGKEPVSPTLPFLQNGCAPEPANGAVFIRSDGGLRLQPPMAYMPPPPPSYGYNNFAAGSSMPLTSAIYGPGSVPVMADSRGAMVSQMMGAPADVLPSYPHGSYLMGMTGPLMGFNGGGTGRPNLDLNFTMEAENRGSGNLGNPFSSQGMLMGEQMRAASQPQSSKRKEPESSWDVYPANCRRQPPWR